MGIIISLLVGALIGWIASMIMKTNDQMGAIANIVVGLVGSSLGSYIFGTVLGIGGAAAAGSFSVVGLSWGILGAIILIAVVKAVLSATGKKA